MWRVLVFVGLLLGTLAAPALATPAPPTTTTTLAVPPLDRRVFIIGDSVILGAQGSIASRLSAEGWQVTQRSQESFHTYNAPGVIDASRSAIGDVAFVELGSNDGAIPADLARYIDVVMGDLRTVPRVYWLNLRRFAPWVPLANATIAAGATRWPNLRILDWDARATPDPSLVYADGLHLNPAGQAAMADLVERALTSWVVERIPPSFPPPPAAPAVETNAPDLTGRMFLGGALLVLGLGGVLLAAEWNGAAVARARVKVTSELRRRP